MNLRKCAEQLLNNMQQPKQSSGNWFLPAAITTAIVAPIAGRVGFKMGKLSNSIGKVKKPLQLGSDFNTIDVVARHV